MWGTCCWWDLNRPFPFKNRKPTFKPRFPLSNAHPIGRKRHLPFKPRKLQPNNSFNKRFMVWKQKKSLKNNICTWLPNLVLTTGVFQQPNPPRRSESDISSLPNRLRLKTVLLQLRIHQISLTLHIQAHRPNKPHSSNQLHPFKPTNPNYSRRLPTFIIKTIRSKIWLNSRYPYHRILKRQIICCSYYLLSWTNRIKSTILWAKNFNFYSLNTWF